MAQCPTAIGLFKRQEIYLTVLRQDRREVFRLTIYFSSQDFLGQAVAYFFDKFEDAFAFLDFADCAVFERNL